ncbi:tyrosine lyase ThiH [Balneicella halophila]|uniref:Tyrosine lyase ThiH n=1 Tax=Balneicella halophila TaxID=1537566 RepID=A0A7L4UNW4_BALHA|nr:2-iminoacetate synthase ThiH [Balneicella halophila]PVX49363.1 tyrosine lyase ThiH [Balneicella halophila]
METFSAIHKEYDWEGERKRIYAKTEADVLTALAKKRKNLDDFQALISPAEQPYLEAMAQQSALLTKKRFGNTVQIYAPMYLSNICTNQCTYCGFSIQNKIPRKILSEEEVRIEMEYLKAKGYEHILLVTGEANKIAGVDYLEKTIEIARALFANVSIEVQPLETNEYKRLVDAGLYAVMVYQETYNKHEYPKYHLRGKKSDFHYRLEAPDRMGMAGMHKIGLGALFGLEDWRADSFFTALHFKYLQKKYWQTKFSMSFPRLRPHEGDVQPKVEMMDADLVQLICAYRLLDEDLELSISTRESADFRNHIVQMGVTTFSAESRTNPGGYAVAPESLEQFSINDTRTTAEVKETLKTLGKEVVWKDWEHFQRW